MRWPLGLIVRVPGPRDDGYVEAVVVGEYEDKGKDWDHGVVVRYESGERRAISYMFVEDDIEMPLAAAARECGLDKAATEALYKAARAGIVASRELRETQDKPRQYVRVLAVQEWAANTYHPRAMPRGQAET